MLNSKEIEMKKIHFSLVALSLVTMALTSGCSNTNSHKSPDAPPVVAVKSYIANINVVDSYSNTPLSGVTLKLSGNAKDVDGNPVTSLKTGPTGVVAFYPDKDADIKIVATLDGYVDSGVEIIANETTISKTLKLLKFEPVKAPVGIVMKKEETQASTTGEVPSDLNVSLGTATKIILPKGVVLEDAEGKPVTGKVSVEAVHYDANTTELFPGGLLALAEDVPADQNGTGERATREVNFVSAGFTSISMKNDSGDAVKNFKDANITIAMTLPNPTINPETGNPVKVGDKIPIWSYDVEKGKWKYEDLGSVIVNPDDSTTWAVIYNASHLSYWNLDWHYSPVCTPAHINITDLAEGTDTITSLTVKGRGFNKTVFDYNGDGYYDLDNVPKTLPLDFTLSYDGKVQDTKTHITLGSACNLEMTLGNVTAKTPVTVKVVEACADGSHQQAIPSIPGYIMSGGAWTYANKSNVDGKMELKLSSDVATRIYVFSPGDRYRNSYIYETIPAGTTEDQTLTFILGSQYDDYCTPVTPPTGGTGAN
jgi:hypothetical protein